MTEAGLLRALERKVDDLSLEVSAQVSSVVQARLHAEVSSAVAAVQEELRGLINQQDEELRQLRAQQHNMQEAVALQLQRAREQNDDKRPNFRPKGKMELMGVDAAAHDAVSLLKELREERALVAEMLDSVKQEKCEVIAMMHSFAMSKGEAIDELEGLRRAACEDAAAAASFVRKAARGCEVLNSSSLAGRQPQEVLTSNGTLNRQPQEVLTSNGTLNRQPQEVPSTCRSVFREADERAEERAAQERAAQERAQQTTAPLQGRQASRTSLCPGMNLQAQTSVTMAAATQAPAQVPGVPMQSPLAGSVMQQQPSVTVVSAAATTFQPQGHDPRRHSIDSMRRVTSPARQYSAGAPAGMLPVSVACSPPMMPRQAAPPLSATTEKSPVRRFVSAGMSPRVQDNLGPSPGWTTMSQATLIR